MRSTLNGANNSVQATPRPLSFFKLCSVFMSIFVQGVPDLTSEVIRQEIFLSFFRAVFDRRFPQLNLIEQTD